MTTPIRLGRMQCVLLALAVVTATRAVDSQQLNYDRTALIHGLGGRASIWTTLRPELNNRSTQQYLGERVELGPVWRPNWDSATTFDREWQDVRDSIAANPGRHVLVSQSLGGLVSRYTYFNAGQATRDNIAAILTVAAPHQGAIIADSIQQLGAFIHDVKRKVQAAQSAIKVTLVGSLGSLLGSLGALMAIFFVNFDAINTPDQLLHTATIPAARTTSAFVSTLNGSGNFDAAIPRGNIVVRMPDNRFMPIRLLAAVENKSEQQAISEFQKNRSLLNTCKNVAGFTLVGFYAALKCSEAERMVGQVDVIWQRFSSGSSSQQFCGQVFTQNGPEYRCWYVMMPRLNIPTDGAVPNERSVYPSHGAGSFFQPPPVAGNHVTGYRIMEGADKMVDVMLNHFFMRPAPTGGGGSGGGGGGGGDPGPGASIQGPSQLGAGVPCQFYASASGGTPPYSYAWKLNGQNHGTDSDVVTAGSTQNFTLEVLVTDQEGRTAPASHSVTIVSGMGCT